MSTIIEPDRGARDRREPDVRERDIRERDFRGFDLNLLVVFHALYEERHVTRAARRLFIGQPALSGALKRLRAAFDDELFVRGPRSMEPTPRAHALARAIEPMLGTLQRELLERPGFEPATAQRVFRIGLSDALEVALLPTLMERLAERAPGLRVVSLSTDGRRAAEMLQAGEIELAIGVFLELAAWQRRRALFDWTFVCVYDPRQVPVRRRRITLAQYLAHPHLLTSFGGELHGFIDERLQSLGHARRVVLASRNFATSPLIARRMRALTTVPTFVAAAWADALGLAVSPLPFEVPRHRVSALWSAAQDADAGLGWLVGLLAECFEGACFD